MMKKVIIISIVITIIVIILITNMNSIVKTFKRDVLKIYGEPIDSTGLINNLYFEINSEGKEDLKTTKGINEAISYASKNNIEYIKLQKGTYLIDGTRKKQDGVGIILKSNITLDINGATLKHIPNDVTNYSIVTVRDVENVKVINAIIIGDKDEHDYTKIKSTHEWGMGIRVLGAKNVELSNIQITNMTGDGIYISEGTRDLSENILICNNNIYDCRRQGISVITARNLIIKNNEIHNIKGTSPQSGIDIERNNNSQVCENTVITGNKIYNLNSGVAIYTHEGITDLKIFNNEIQGKINIKNKNETIQEYDNKIL